VVGAIDLEAALTEGRAAFQPGLLAAAHRALLYVDEVNLLDDHLVDVLLDVAVTGVNVVAREGVTCTHPARFLLIGTMNPEEGDLRPQLLDRFGLCVEVTAEGAPAQRKEIIRRSLAYQADSRAFAAQWTEAEATLRAQLQRARALLPTLTPPEALLDFAAQVAVEMQVDGHRAEITLIKTALALAALHGRPRPAPADLRLALPLALRHRTKRLPLQTAKLDPGAFDRLLAQVPGRGFP
jgi:Mg-chelatase subunit ChlI